MDDNFVGYAVRAAGRDTIGDAQVRNVTADPASHQTSSSVIRRVGIDAAALHRYVICVGVPGVLKRVKLDG